MHIYLNSPRAFWQIPETDIRLTRESPIREVTNAQLESLTGDQQRILNQSIETGILAKVARTFVPNADNVNEKILKLPISEIHRRYVSSFIMTKNIEKVQALLNLEEKSKKPRADLVRILNSARSSILEADPEIKFMREIEEAVEEIEGVIVESKPPVKPSRKRRGRPKKVVGENK